VALGAGATAYAREGCGRWFGQADPGKKPAIAHPLARNWGGIERMVMTMSAAVANTTERNAFARLAKRPRM